MTAVLDFAGRTLAYRKRILARISDPAVQKTLIVRWGMNGDISAADAETLIRELGLKEA